MSWLDDAKNLVGDVAKTGENVVEDSVKSDADVVKALVTGNPEDLAKSVEEGFDGAKSLVTGTVDAVADNAGLMWKTADDLFNPGDVFSTGLSKWLSGLFGGDSGGSSIADELQTMASQLESLGRQLTQDATGASWQGEAADAFRSHTTNLSQQFSQIADDLNQAASIAATLASEGVA
jgi:uncharacterized protein YukE